MLNLKAAFSSVQAKANQETNVATQTLPSYLQSGSAKHLMAASNNINLKLPATRQMQCASGALPPSRGLLSTGIESHIPGPISPSAAQGVSSPKEMRPVLHIVPNGKLSL
ncbi:hypothetical protein C0992_000110 [Termitomyces sp. T32_za158]|nr:hypothetical protein C0992_000110 [Termitomyces sp. T32_za158]